MQNYFLFKLLPEMFEVQTNFWNSTLQFRIAVFFQRNAVACNLVIEESSFH